MSTTGHALLVDAHAHYYPVFHPRKFLDAAANRFRAAAGGRPTTGYVLLAEVAGNPVFSRWRDGPPPSPEWAVDPTDEAPALIASDDRGRRLVLVDGQQVVTRNGLEVLIFGTSDRIPDGMVFEDAVAAAVERAPLVVVPRGFGKWWGERGDQVKRVADRHGNRLFLGDTPGWRPPTASGRDVFWSLRAAGIRHLRGSDPLPFADHAGAVARVGSVVPGAADARRPLSALMDALGSGEELGEFGEPEPLVQFARDQLRLRLR